MKQEPFAARLHFIPRALRAPQAGIVRIFRRYFECAPGWVLLTTTGRISGLPREVLLPCERYSEGLIVISTYGWRSHWIRNISHQPEVRVTCGGWVLSGRAEVVEDQDLFQDPSIDVARMAAGEEREILVPVEVGEGAALRRFKLSVRLRLDPVD